MVVYFLFLAQDGMNDLSGLPSRSDNASIVLERVALTSFAASGLGRSVALWPFLYIKSNFVSSIWRCAKEREEASKGRFRPANSSTLSLTRSACVAFHSPVRMRWRRQSPFLRLPLVPGDVSAFGKRVAKQG